MRATCEHDYEMGYENCYECFHHDSSVLQPNSWFQASPSLENMDDFPNIFEVLKNVPLSPGSSGLPNSNNIASNLEVTCDPDDNCQPFGTVRKCEELMHKNTSSQERKGKQNEQTRKTHSAQVHNMTEKRRRARIREKMKTLQKLIPNCDKSDSTSVLDDAINYVKALKLQVESYVSACGGGILFKAPCISPGGTQSTQQGSQLSPSVGMFCSSCCPPMTSVPSWSYFNPSLSQASLSPMSVHGNRAIPQMQLPTSAMPQNFTPALNFSSRGNYDNSQTIITSNY